MDVAAIGPDFELPPELEAAEPPEARGLRRDEVRLLVSDVENDTIEHARFSNLPRWLSAGDVLVVNTSGTLNAAVSAVAEDGRVLELHLSTRLPGGFWTVEVRQPGLVASERCHDARAGMTLLLPAGGCARLLAPYPLIDSPRPASRLWMAALELPCAAGAYFDQYGFPIRYGYVRSSWPSAMYQTVFATEPGSAEMPSAGRPFTPELVTRLVSRGVEIAPLVLHTGVASLESHEPPYEEQYRVTSRTAERVNAARTSGRRVIAVGTTVVRALETVTDDTATTHPGEGWTDLVITPDRPLRSVNGLVTGLHEPRATHLALLETVITRTGGSGGPGASTGSHGHRHLARAYAEARQHRYLWHEFGDSHLILARRARRA